MKKTRKLEMILIFFTVVIILFFSMIHIDKLDSLVIYNDEFGYWSSAAYFAGLDWENVVSQIQYYSFGYGVILLPILLLVSNSWTAYKIAVFVNAILLVISFLISIKCIRKLYPEISKVFAIGVCFLLAVFPANIVYAHYTLSETLVYTIFWGCVYFFIRIADKVTSFKVVAILLLLLGLYISHQRSIGVVASGICILICLFWCHKVSLKQVLIAITILGSGALLCALVKSGLIEKFYLNSDLIGYTDYSGQGEKISYLFSKEGCIIFIFNLLGRLWYIFLSSYGMAFWGLISIFAGVVSFCKKKFVIKEMPTNKEWIFMFIGCSFVSTLFISALTMIYPLRVDHLIYGRYTEFLIPIIIIIGIIEVTGNKNTKRQIFIYILISTFLTICINPYIMGWVEKSEHFQNTIANLGTIGIAPYLTQDSNYTNGLVYEILCVQLFWSVLLFAVIGIKKQWKEVRFGLCLAGILTSVLIVRNVEYSMELTVLSDQKNKEENTLAVASYLDSLEWEPEIYFTPGNQYMESIQFYFSRKEMKRIDIKKLLNDAKSLPVDGVVIEKNASGNVGKLEEEYIKVFETELLTVLVNQDSIYAQ